MIINPKPRTLMLTLVRALLLLIPLLLVSPAKAHAYTDPGTGAFLYQAAYAAFLGGTFYLRRFLDRVFRRKADRREDGSGAAKAS
jgi:hypothetical protein